MLLNYTPWFCEPRVPPKNIRLKIIVHLVSTQTCHLPVLPQINVFNGFILEDNPKPKEEINERRVDLWRHYETCIINNRGVYQQYVSTWELFYAET